MSNKRDTSHMWLPGSSLVVGMGTLEGRLEDITKLSMVRRKTRGMDGVESSCAIQLSKAKPQETVTNTAGLLGLGFGTHSQFSAHLSERWVLQIPRDQILSLSL